MLDTTSSKPRRVQWQNVSTVIAAAVLIGAEVFGAAFAGGWALANLFELGSYGEYAITAVFSVIGLYVMYAFVRKATTIEPFYARN